MIEKIYKFIVNCLGDSMEKCKVSNNDSSFIDKVYIYTLIESLVFNIDIKKDIKQLIDITNIDKNILLKNLNEYLKINKDDNIFDDEIRKNYYYLIDYLVENSGFLEKKEQNSLVREMKITLNNLSLDNLEYLKEQILLREYALINYELNHLFINTIKKQTILNNKYIYYNSISKDFVFLQLLLMDDEEFDKNYSDYLLNIDFYRSMNYFTSVYSDLFKNLNIFNRLKIIIENDEILLKTGKYDEQDTVKYFNSILNVTKKVVKKLERTNR